MRGHLEIPARSGGLHCSEHGPVRRYDVHRPKPALIGGRAGIDHGLEDRLASGIQCAPRTIDWGIALRARSAEIEGDLVACDCDLDLNRDRLVADAVAIDLVVRFVDTVRQSGDRLAACGFAGLENPIESGF